jgi:hypothetical protein
MSDGIQIVMKDELEREIERLITSSENIESKVLKRGGKLVLDKLSDHRPIIESFRNKVFGFWLGDLV